MPIIVPSNDQSYPIIGHDNLLEQGSVVATSAASGYPVENCYDWLDYDYWKPQTLGLHTITLTLSAAALCDYFAIFAHNLGECAASIRLYYSTASNVGPWTAIGNGFAPAGSEAKLEIFTPVSARWWQIAANYSGEQIPYLGMVAFGKRLQMPAGIAPGFSPPIANDYEITSGKSETGSFLGTSVRRQPRDLNVPFNPIEISWIEQHWTPFIQERAIRKPFFFAWDSEQHGDQVVFCRVNKAPPHPTFSANRHLSINLKVEAVIS